GELRNYQPTDDASEDKNKAAAERLDKLRKEFVKMFANPPRDPEVEFQPSVRGTLFALNNARIQELFRRRDGNLIDRLSKLPDDQAADELFLAVLSRQPSPEDRADVGEFLKRSGDRETVLGQLAWALWSSNEFFINH
ncbi:MAG: hypothetical protein N2C14_09110, partial [Planctomycetales bacterium]